MEPIVCGPILLSMATQAKHNSPKFFGKDEKGISLKDTVAKIKFVFLHKKIMNGTLGYGRIRNRLGFLLEACDT